MFDLPLHPMVVHFPIALAFLAPIAGAAMLWAIRRRYVSAGGWLAVVGLHAVLVASAAVSVTAGERDEERVEAVVSERLIERHAEWGERFLWASALTLALTGAGLVKRSRDTLRVLSVIAATAVAAVSLWTGHSGGELVYRHGAAQVHVPRGSPSGPAAAVHENEGH